MLASQHTVSCSPRGHLPPLFPTRGVAVITRLAGPWLVLLVSSFTSLAATAQTPDKWAIESTATCPGQNGETLSFSFRLELENCLLHAETSGAFYPNTQAADEPTFTEV